MCTVLLPPAVGPVAVSQIYRIRIKRKQSRHTTIYTMLQNGTEEYEKMRQTKQPYKQRASFDLCTKGKVIPLQARCGPDSSMTAVLEGGERSAARPGRTLPPGKDPIPILQEAWWAPGQVWTGGKSRPHRDSIPDSPARSSHFFIIIF